jgi:hypothetical protein
MIRGVVIHVFENDGKLFCDVSVHVPLPDDTHKVVKFPARLEWWPVAVPEVSSDLMYAASIADQVAGILQDRITAEARAMWGPDAPTRKITSETPA